MLPVTLAVLASLCAGRVYANNEIVRDVNVTEGDNFSFSVVTALHTEVVKCFLEPPQSDIIEFEPDNVSQSTDRYQVLNGNFISQCQVEVKNFDDSDQGYWNMYYDHPDGRGDSQRYLVKVLPKDIPTTEPSVFEETLNLSEIEHYTTKDALIDISLNKESFEEECYVVPPNGGVMKADIPVDGVTVQSSSDFVSCRITIGPMVEGLLGQWSLCGKSKTDGNMRCQPANISWHSDTPNAEWDSEVHDRFDHPVHFGGSVNPGVWHHNGAITCHIITPNGEDLVLTKDVHYPNIERVSSEDSGLCSVLIKVVDQNSLGDWTVYGKYKSANYDELSEVRLPMTFKLYNPDDPYEQAYNVTMLPSAHRTVNLGRAINMEVTGSLPVHQCQFTAPTGRTFYSHGSEDFDGVSFVKAEDEIVCRIAIGPITPDMVGQWELIGKFNDGYLFDEKVQMFNIAIEEEVNAVPNQVNIAEGSDLRLRLEKSTELFETCKLTGPEGTSVTYEIDPLHINSCGYVIKTVSQAHSGKWMIVYGNKIVYRAVIDVNVFAVSAENQIWTLGTPVHTTIGPEDAVYCKLQNANGMTVFDSFGRCVIDIERVTLDHQGAWRMSIGMPGAVLLHETAFIVNVNEAVSIPVVTTRVERVAPSVMLTCSVPSEYEVKGCKFRDHRGNIMLAHHGVGQDVGTGAVTTSFESEVSANGCTLQIKNPTAADLGLWRCAVDTDVETLYGFMNVTCPWLMQNPDVAASVNLEPTLTQERSNIVSPEGDSTVMSCAIDASIRYCYFRARNGSIFNLRPDLSTVDYEYVGAGFHAGDCGIRLKNLLTTDSGRWSCHVGLFDTSAPEQSKRFEVEVKEKMTVSHYRDYAGQLVLEGELYDNHRVEYCRYIRIDGLGFTSDSVPEGYTVNNALMANGYCTLVMAEPTMLNMHPWTVVAKLAGVDQEVVKYSVDHLMVGDSPVIGGGPGNNYSVILLWVSCAMILLTLATLGAALITKKNRNWAHAKATAIRDSFRKVPYTNTEKTPPAV